MIDSLALNEFKETKCWHLSGGNQRKLCVSLALLGSPSYIFLDELSTGIDPISKMHVSQVLKGLKEKSVILSTHWVEEAENLCDYVYILKEGKLNK